MVSKSFSFSLFQTPDEKNNISRENFAIAVAEGQSVDLWRKIVFFVC